MEQEIFNRYSYLLNLFSNAVKQKRSVSIKELSDKSGVSTAVISDFENKKYLPKIEILLRLFYVLDIKISDLVKREDLAKEIKVIEEEMLTLTDRIAEAYDAIRTSLNTLGLSNHETNDIIGYIEYKVNKNNLT